MVWRTILWSDPNDTGPAVTVRVFRRTTSRSDSQYLPLCLSPAIGP